ncbi:MAG: MOSC domain-containing protein [Acidimicrobiales bacterium]
MHVVSVQTATPTTISIGDRVASTGIRKTSVERVDLTALGLVGDTIVDTANHGGIDQAVYAYSAEDTAWWESELGRELAPGAFGENLVLSSFGPDPVRVGDRYIIGAVVLEVTSPRIPCNKFSAVMNERDWIRRFRDARRPGWYARVITEGRIHPGDPVERTPAPESNAEVLELQDLYYAGSSADRRRLDTALRSPVAIRFRGAFTPA